MAYASILIEKGQGMEIQICQLGPQSASAQIAGLARLFDAYRQFYDQPTDFAAAQSFIGARLAAQDAALLLAEQDGLAVGFCQLYPSFCSILVAPIYIVHDLFVAPAARHQGVGRALMLYAEQVALRDGKKRMDLSTAKTNLTAQGLYETLGWRRDENFFVYSRIPGAACSLTDYSQHDYLD